MSDGWQEVTKSKQRATKSGKRGSATHQLSAPSILFCKLAKGSPSPGDVFNLITQFDKHFYLAKRPPLLQIGHNLGLALQIEQIGPQAFLVNFAEKEQAERCLQVSHKIQGLSEACWWSEQMSFILKYVSQKIWFFSLWLGNRGNGEPLDKTEICQTCSTYGELYHPEPNSAVSVLNGAQAFVNFRTLAQAKNCFAGLGWGTSRQPAKLSEFAKVLSAVLCVLHQSSPPAIKTTDEVRDMVKERDPQAFCAFETKFQAQFHGLLTLTNTFPCTSPFDVFLTLSCFQDPDMFKLSLQSSSVPTTIQLLPIQPSTMPTTTSDSRQPGLKLLPVPAVPEIQAATLSVPPGVYRVESIGTVTAGDAAGNALQSSSATHIDVHTVLELCEKEFERQCCNLARQASQITFQNAGVWCMSMETDGAVDSDTVLAAGDFVGCEFLEYSFVGVIQGVHAEYLTLFMPHELEQFASTEPHNSSGSACHLSLSCIRVTFHPNAMRQRFQRLRQVLDHRSASEMQIQKLKEQVHQLQCQLEQAQSVRQETDAEVYRLREGCRELKVQVAVRDQEKALLAAYVREEHDQQERLREALAFAEETNLAKDRELAARHANSERRSSTSSALNGLMRTEAACSGHDLESANAIQFAEVHNQYVKAHNHKHDADGTNLDHFPPLAAIPEPRRRPTKHPEPAPRYGTEVRAAGAGQPQDELDEAGPVPVDVDQPIADVESAGTEECKERSTSTSAAVVAEPEGTDEGRAMGRQDQDFPVLGAVQGSTRMPRQRRPEQPACNRAIQDKTRQARTSERGCLQCGTSNIARNEPFCSSCEESGVFFLGGQLQHTPRDTWQVINPECCHCTAPEDFEEGDDEGLCTCKHVKKFSNTGTFHCDGQPPALQHGDWVYFLPSGHSRAASLLHEANDQYFDCRVLDVADFCTFTNDRETRHSSDVFGWLSCPALYDAGVLKQVWDQALCFNHEWVHSCRRGQLSIVVGSCIDIPRIKAVRRPRSEYCSKWVLVAAKPKSRCKLQGNVEVLPTLSTILDDSSVQSFRSQSVMPNCGWWEDAASYLRTSFELLWTESFLPMCLLIQSHRKGAEDRQWGQVYERARFQQLIMRKAHVGLRLQLSRGVDTSSGSFKGSNLVAVLLRAPASTRQSQDSLFWATSDGQDRLLRCGVVDLYLVSNDKDGGVESASVETVMNMLELILTGFTITLYESEAFFEAHRYSLSRLARLVNGSTGIVGVNELVARPSPCHCGDGDLSNTADDTHGSEAVPLKFRASQLNRRLNTAQNLACRYASDNTRNEVFRLVVGPPGTGKSHVGTILLNDFCNEPAEPDSCSLQKAAANPPILVVSNNNGPVDSCLVALVRNPSNIFVAGKDVVRIGGQTSLPPEYKLIRNAKNSTMAASAASSIPCRADEDVSDQLLLQCKHITRHRPPQFALVPGHTGKSSGKTRESGSAKYRKEEEVNDAKEERDVIELAEETKIASVFRDASKKRQFAEELRTVKLRAEDKVRKSDESIVQSLRACRVIGATVTGAAKHAHLLSRLGIKMVMVEEAAQTVEGDLVACLPPDVERVVMLGDHRQTQPNLSNTIWRKHLLTDLAAPKSKPIRFNLSLDRIRPNLSLFERLIRCRHSHVSLTVQYRMPSLLADLVRNSDPQWPLYQRSLYRDGEVSDTLRQRRLEFERRCNVWSSSDASQKCLHLINHQLPEQRVMHHGSPRGFYNPGEASMIVGVVEWLLKQGIDARTISILAMYKAQATHIESRLKERCLNRTFNDFRYRMIEDDSTLALGKVRVFTVDGFQGSENDVILLSLTRSNPSGQKGWVSDYRRIGVSLSRAKVAQFVFGNLHCLRKDERIHQAALAYSAGEIWAAIVLQAFEHKGYTDNSRVLVRCQRHPSEEASFDLSKLCDKPELLPAGLGIFAPDGGCSNPEDSIPSRHGSETSSFTDCDSDSLTDAEDHFSDCEPGSGHGRGVKGGRCLKCDADMRLFCHPCAQQSVKCVRRCKRILGCKHRCIRQCRDTNCDDACLHPVLVELGCGHTQAVPCCIRASVGSCAELRSELQKLKLDIEAQSRDHATRSEVSSATDTLAQAIPGLSASFTTPMFYSLHECAQCGASVLLECGQDPSQLICLRKCKEISMPLSQPQYLNFAELHVLPSDTPDLGIFDVVKPYQRIMQQDSVDMVCCKMYASLGTVVTTLRQMQMQSSGRVVIGQVKFEMKPDRQTRCNVASNDIQLGSSALAESDDAEEVAVSVDIGVESRFSAEMGSLHDALAGLGGPLCEFYQKRTNFDYRDAEFRLTVPPEFNWTDLSTQSAAQLTATLDPARDLVVELVTKDSCVELGRVHRNVVLGSCDFLKFIVDFEEPKAHEHSTKVKPEHSGKKKKARPQPMTEIAAPAALPGEKLQFNGEVVTEATASALICFLYSPQTFRQQALSKPPPARELLQLLRLSFLLGLLYLHQICESLLYQTFEDDISVMSQVADSAASVSDPVRECRHFFAPSHCGKLQGHLALSRRSTSSPSRQGAVDPLAMLRLPTSWRDAWFAPKLQSQCLFLAQTRRHQYRLSHPELQAKLETFTTVALTQPVLQDVEPRALAWSPSSGTETSEGSSYLTFRVTVANFAARLKNMALEAVLTFYCSCSSQQQREVVNAKLEAIHEGVASIEVKFQFDKTVTFAGYPQHPDSVNVQLQYHPSSSGDEVVSIIGERTVLLLSSPAVTSVSPQAARPGGMVEVHVRGENLEKVSSPRILLRPSTKVTDKLYGAKATSGENAQECVLEVMVVESDVTRPGVLVCSAQIPRNMAQGVYHVLLFEAGQDENERSRRACIATVTIFREVVSTTSGWHQNPESKLVEYRPDDLTSYLLQVFWMYHVTEEDCKRSWLSILCSQQADCDSVDLDCAHCEVFTSSLAQDSKAPAMPDMLQSCLAVFRTPEHDEVMCCVGADHLSLPAQRWVRTRFSVPFAQPGESPVPHAILVWDYLKRNLANSNELPSSLDDMCRFITAYTRDPGSVDVQQLNLDLGTRPDPADSESESQSHQQTSSPTREEEDLGDLGTASGGMASQPWLESRTLNVLEYARKGWDVETFTNVQNVKRNQPLKCRLLQATERVSGVAVALKVPKIFTRRQGASADAIAAEVSREWDALQFFRVHPSDFVVGGIAKMDAWRCFVMPWYEGDTLQVVMDNLESGHASPAAPEFVQILVEVAAGLDHMHTCGWIHGSVCPSNVLLATPSKLTGLTLAQPSPSTLSDSLKLENLACAAPECLRSAEHPSCTCASDVYSFGTILLRWFKGVDHSHFLDRKEQDHVAEVVAFASLGSGADDEGELRRGSRALPCQGPDAFREWELALKASPSCEAILDGVVNSPQLRRLVFLTLRCLVSGEVTAGSGVELLLSDMSTPLRSCARGMGASALEALRGLGKRCLEVASSQRPTAADLRVELLTYTLLDVKAS